MNLVDLKKKLIAAARRHPPVDDVPYGFEKRVMTRLVSLPRPDEWTLCVRALWFGASVCAAIALLMAVWFFAPVSEPDTPSFSQDLEQTILATAGDGESIW
ncbi:MAG TPA: hypothetical protein VEO53_14015 [Candidatus Binatia bacterium]|nr:hypothetical protein [Candidatus Binatia bacterium]